MDVAILGASGDCGRAIAGQLVASRLLGPTERLQLVGRREGPSARALHGLVSDLTDAHAEYVPELDVALAPEEIVADLWVISAGRTPPTDHGMVDRAALAAYNASVFDEYAETLAKHGQGTEVVIIVSNPVELGVALFSRAVGRDRVIGIGAYQDTLRFRREIAADLGIRRQRVGAFMLGEHGEGQVPLWSSVKLYGLSEDETESAVTRLRRGTEETDFAQLVRDTREHLVGRIAEGQIAEAFAYLDTLPPDVRVVIKPFITHLSGSKTVMATANVTVALVETLLKGDEALIAGQVDLEEGEFYGMTGVLGVPIIASPNGVMRVVEVPLSPHEHAEVKRISESVRGKVKHWLETVDAERKGKR